MAGNFTDGIWRTDAAPDPLVPQPLATAIIQEAPKASAALTLMNKTTLSAKTQRLPVLDVLPMAYWVGGDTGLKQTTRQAWQNIVMVVEELACIVPIPIAYMADADVPLWSQVQPRITEAVGALIDSAVLWGINKPATWGESVFVGATKSGHTEIEGTGTDLGQDVSNLGEMMAQTGYTVNGFAAMPGMSWKMVGIRSAQGIPIYQPDMTGTPGGRLYGYQMTEVNNGSWQLPTAGAIMLAGDFSKAIIGIRQDITFKIFTEGVVSDDTGKVILNLMQQDAVAMRMVMRLAYATVNPVTIMHPTLGITARWPFGAVLGMGTTPPTTGPINQITGYPTTGGQMAPLGEGEEGVGAGLGEGAGRGQLSERDQLRQRDLEPEREHLQPSVQDQSGGTAPQEREGVGRNGGTTAEDVESAAAQHRQTHQQRGRGAPRSTGGNE